MDCSWGHGLNHACDGGDQDEAIQYIVEAGGIAPEASYTYRGQDSFCRDKNLSDGELVQFKVGNIALRHRTCKCLMVCGAHRRQLQM